MLSLSISSHFGAIHFLNVLRSIKRKISLIGRLAVDMDRLYRPIHGYIHVWILDFSHPVDISMDIVSVAS